LAAIQFNDHLAFQADEIDDESLEWMLPAEFTASHLAAAEVLP